MLNFKYSTIVFLIGCLLLSFLFCTLHAPLWVFGLWILLYLILVSFGVVKLSASFFLPVLYKGNTTSKLIALTFDDGPNKDVTPKVLNLLKKHNINATFFCIGSRMPGNETLIQKIHQSGHIIGNHTYSHANTFDFFSTSKVKKELEETEQLMISITGKQMQLFRPPFGITNPNIAKAVSLLDYKTIGWSIRTFDTVSDNKKRILKKVNNQLQNGSVILLHDVNEYVLDILEEIILLAKSRGYGFVTIDKMFSIKAYKN